MEQFRQIGEVMGSLKALMVFQDNLINLKQCCLMVDMFDSGYTTIANLMRHNLRLEEKNTKWKIIEQPLKELWRVFKEGEGFIKQCLEPKEWWAKAFIFHHNNECVEFHIHNLLTCIPIMIEAIELAAQISGDEMQKKHMYSIKYRGDMKDPATFQCLFGDQYLTSRDICRRIKLAPVEDRWLLMKAIKDKKDSKRGRCVADILLRYLDMEETDDVLFPSTILVHAKDYSVRRRLGNGKRCKEIQWLGESFALRQIFKEVSLLAPKIRREVSLYHPNVIQILCAFVDDGKNECFLVMELMSRDLSSHIKETCGPKKRVPFSLPAAVDLLLQIARGMEYLHSMNICHGELNSSNILVKSRGIGIEGYVLAKVSGFGLSASTDEGEQCPPLIWYAPEALAELDKSGGVESSSKYTEKCDVYSFGMICFEVLTGKVPFEDAHLQGDKTGRNIRAGERPLFPFHSPKYLTNLTKKCWHGDPGQRPSFASICRMLRYTKRFLVMNPECNEPDSPLPPIDFSEIEAVIMKSFPVNGKLMPVTQIPFHMFAYRVTEREKANTSHQRDISESGSDGSTHAEENAPPVVDEPFSPPLESKSLPPPEIVMRRLSLTKKSTETLKKSMETTKMKSLTQPGTPKGRGRFVRPPHTPARRTTMRMKSGTQPNLTSSKLRRSLSGHVSDSELS